MSRPKHNPIASARFRALGSASLLTSRETDDERPERKGHTHTHTTRVARKRQGENSRHANLACKAGRFV